MSPRGLISAKQEAERLVNEVRSLRKIPVKPEPATLDRVHVLKLSRGAGIPACSCQPLSAARKEAQTLITHTRSLFFKTAVSLTWLLY